LNDGLLRRPGGAAATREFLATGPDFTALAHRFLGPEVTTVTSLVE
jgi:hypothetical protein